jgi:hypothetical protein
MKNVLVSSCMLSVIKNAFDSFYVFIVIKNAVGSSSMLLVIKIPLASDVCWGCDQKFPSKMAVFCLCPDDGGSKDL